MNSLDTCFSRNVFEAVQKTRSTCFIGSKTTWLRIVVLNPDKTLLRAGVSLSFEVGEHYRRVAGQKITLEVNFFMFSLKVGRY